VGRWTFTRRELDEIRRLLVQKGTADRDCQKAIRDRLRRRFDFYISDFTSRTDGFTASDLDDLIESGTVEILDEPPSDDRSEAVFSTRSAESATHSEARDVLPDILGSNLRVVFCGTAVGGTSARKGAYYADPGNEFWRVLARVGLTPRVLAPSEFLELLRYGIGLTDLAKFVSGSDMQVRDSEFNVEGFKRKIESADPNAIGFNGKRAAEAIFGRPVEYGRHREQLGKVVAYVLPSTSGAARGYWDERYWHEMAQFLGPADFSPSRVSKAILKAGTAGRMIPSYARPR
jgi:double-stranded uracil-DNA glycosylase